MRRSLDQTSMPRPWTITLLVFLTLAIAFWKTAAISASKEIFTDITEQAGITWRQFGGESQDRFLIETMGGGVAFVDFDNDGLLDIFFVNGGETPHGKSPLPLSNALYRNLGNGKFENVAAKASVDKVTFYGMGVAAADFDNDGYQDLYVTGYPASALFHNNGDGTFTDVTDKAGAKNEGKWAAGAAWFDYDRDGLLDLVVTNYAQFSFQDPKNCELNHVRAYCAQTAYTGLPLTLYHNNGNGTFSDVSRRFGFDKLIGRGLGVVAIDVNDDGWPDLFIARDASPNLLLINKQDGTFEDVALEAEVAYDQNGIAKSGMGIDAGDVNGDGIPDFVITNFNDQYHSLFLGSKSLAFSDHTIASHLAGLTKTFVGWGAKFFDYDNDGNLDLMLMNGHINPEIDATGVDVKYKERALLLRNDGNGVFEDMREVGGAAFQRSYLGRSLTIGDFDNDGDPDATFTTLNGTPVLLRNNVGQDNSWIGFSLQGTVSNRDAIGARITVTSSGRTLTRWIAGGGSYLASHDKRVLVGLGSSAKPVDADIRWPNGSDQHLSNLQPRQYHHLVEPASPVPSKKSQN